MPNQPPSVIEEVIALRGFAWSGEVAPELGCTEGVVVLTAEGAPIGFAPIKSEEADPYSLFDAIEPLTTSERSYLLVSLEDFEVELLDKFLAQAQPSQRQWLSRQTDLPDLGDASTPDDASAVEAPVGTQFDLRALERRIRAIAAQVLADGVSQGIIPTDPDVAALCQKVRSIRERVFADSIRLAVFEAKNHAQGFDWTLAVSAACEGIAEAMDRFESSRGYQFSTYALYWVRAKVRRARANHSLALRIPVHAQETLSRFARAERELWAVSGRRPLESEVAAKLPAEHSRYTPKIADLRRPVRWAHVGSDGDPGEYVIDPHVPSPTEGGLFDAWIPDFEQRFREVAHAAAMLVARAREEPAARNLDIILSRCAVGRSRAETLQEIGERYEISRERIRQLEERVLAVLAKTLPRDHADHWLLAEELLGCE